MDFILAVIVWFGLALAAGAIASSKSRSFFGYFVLSLCLPLIGIIVAIGMAPLNSHVQASTRPNDLVLCHSCGRPRRIDSISCPNCLAGKPDPHAGLKKCEACAEWIMREAKKCKHCGEIIATPAPARKVKSNWGKVDEVERSLDQRRR